MGFGGSFVGTYSGPLAGTPYAKKLLSVAVFDGGLGKPQRAVVIDSMIVLLDRLRREQGGYVQAIEGTTTIARGVGDEEACADVNDQLMGRAPGILIATGDMDFDTAGDTDRWKSPLRVHVYFYVNSMRDRFDGRGTADVVALADGTADPGAFVLLEHARMLLAAQRPGGKSLAELRPLTERRIATDGDREIWEQIYICNVSQIVNVKRDIALELKQINTYNRLSEQLDSDAPIVSIESKVGKT